MPTRRRALLTGEGETVYRIGTIEGGQGGGEARISFHPAGGLAGMRRRVAILISGRGSNMASLIAAARDHAYPAEIVLVLSNRPDAAGPGAARARPGSRRGRSITGRSAATARRMRRRSTPRCMAAEIEIVCLAGYMRLLTPLLVDAWRGRMLNIHPSLLPAFPGPAYPRARHRGRA